MTEWKVDQPVLYRFGDQWVETKITKVYKNGNFIIAHKGTQQFSKWGTQTGPVTGWKRGYVYEDNVENRAAMVENMTSDRRRRRIQRAYDRFHKIKFTEVTDNQLDLIEQALGITDDDK